MDEETRTFLEDTLGVVVPGSSLDEQNDNSNNFGLGPETEEEDEDDDDFDEEEEKMDDCESLAEDREEERRLVKEKIGRDEMDALSVTSVAGESDSENNDSDEGASANENGKDGGGSAKNNAPRRRRRRRFAFPMELTSGGDDNDDDEDDERSGRSSARPDTDVGALDVTNIVRGKRRRTKVDYRKLADVMFGDESDDEAKGAKKEYTYNPRKAKPAKARRIKKVSENGDSDNDNDTVRKKVASPENGTIHGTERLASHKGKEEEEEENSLSEKARAISCNKKVGSPKRSNSKIEGGRRAVVATSRMAELKPENAQIGKKSPSAQKSSINTSPG